MSRSVETPSGDRPETGGAAEADEDEAAGDGVGEVAESVGGGFEKRESVDKD